MSEHPTHRLPWWGFAFWVCASSVIAIVGILRVQSKSGETPFLSANDRSRWCTIASLIEEGTFVIDRWHEYRDPTTKRRVYQTIDRVQTVDQEGQVASYSSKPALLPIVQAGAYGIVRAVTGWRLPDRPFLVGQSVLLIVNGLPWLIYLLAIAWLLQRCSESRWGQSMAMAQASLGTLLLPMTVTLNNHLPAAVAALLAWCLVVRRFRQPQDAIDPATSDDRSQRFALPSMVLAGLAAGWMASCELPAMSLVVLLGVAIYWKDGMRLAVGYGLGAGLIGLAAIGANLWAYGSWRPAYAHRGLGLQHYVGPQPTLDQITNEGANHSAADWQDELWQIPVEEKTDPSLEEKRRTAIESMFNALREPMRRGGADRSVCDAKVTAVRWSKKSTSQKRTAEVSIDRAPWRLAWVLEERAGQSGTIGIYDWDDWYDYPGSYWTGGQQGVDQGEPSRWRYALHSTIGHHGVFSLTPAWCLVPVGLWGWRARLPRLRMLATVVAMVTVICVVFYWSRPLVDRNYGGVSCGFRWLFWLTPLWLWGSIPAWDALGRRVWGRVVGLGLIGGSMVAVAGAMSNPWQHPWLYEKMVELGWI
jgi:hypothetical protein